MSEKKTYRYNNRVQAVVKPFVLTGIKAEAKITGASRSEIAARILEDYYKPKQGRQSKNTY